MKFMDRGWDVKQMQKLMVEWRRTGNRRIRERNCRSVIRPICCYRASRGRLASSELLRDATLDVSGFC